MHKRACSSSRRKKSAGQTAGRDDGRNRNGLAFAARLARGHARWGVRRVRRRFVDFAYPAAQFSCHRAMSHVITRLAGGMNAAPWEGMQNSRSSSVVEHSLTVVELSRPLVEAATPRSGRRTIQRRDRDLASQLRRAISSIALNTAEGLATAAGNARLRFETARGSLNEAQAGIRVAVAWGYVLHDSVCEVLESMHCLGGRVYGLVRR